MIYFGVDFGYAMPQEKIAKKICALLKDNGKGMINEIKRIERESRKDIDWIDQRDRAIELGGVKEVI